GAGVALTCARRLPNHRARRTFPAIHPPPQGFNHRHIQEALVKPVRWSLAVLVAALIVTGCGHDAATGPSPRESSPDFSRRGRPSTGGPASYVILHGGGSLPPGLARPVEAAGGAITGALPQIGVTFATPGAADVAPRASWDPGRAPVAPGARSTRACPTR